jgi:hypothetical protein
MKGAIVAAVGLSWSVVVTGASAHPDASCPGSESHILVLDLTSEATNRALAYSSLDPDVGQLSRDLVAAVGSSDAVTIAVALKSAHAALEHTDTRWISSTGDRLDIYLFHESKTSPAMEFKEQARRTKIGDQIAALIETVVGIDPSAAMANLQLEHRVYCLEKKRSNLKVTASLSMEEPAVASKKIAAEANLITGPREHWFLSADVIVNDIDELKVNEETGEIEPEKSPETFLFGINYGFGDILGDHNHFVLKLLFEGSSDPQNKMGAAIGYRFSGEVAGFELQAISPYVGVLRVRGEDDELDDEEEFVAGISLNFDKLLASLK